jgi:hypothetical protein
VVDSIRIHDNYAMDNEIAGFVLAGWGQPTSHTIRNIEMSRNISCRNHEVGINLVAVGDASLENVRLYNNLVYGNQRWGIRLSGNQQSTRHPMRHIEILNNTVYGNGTAQNRGGGVYLNSVIAEDIVLKSNIVSDNASYPIWAEADVAIRAFTLDHNLLFPSTGDDRFVGTHPIRQKPSFVDPGHSDFRLLPTSAAIDNGASENAPADDFDGNPRPLGKGYDIGAFELMK